jgi:hypothetical protein
MKIKLYESLNSIINEIFEVDASEVQNFKDFIRREYKSKIDNKILKDDDFLSQVFIQGKMDLSDKKIEKEIKNAIGDYQSKLDPISKRKLLAALYFYTNNFPFIWNTYIEAKNNEKLNEVFKISTQKGNKEINSKVENIKKVYIGVLSEIKNSFTIRIEVDVEKKIDNKIKKLEQDIDSKIKSKINSKENSESILKDMYVYFRKNKIVEKIRSKREALISKRKNRNKKLVLIQNILDVVNSNTKIEESDIVLLNTYILNDEEVFYDSTYNKELIFNPEFKKDSREILTDLINFMGFEVNNGKKYKQLSSR